MKRVIACVLILLCRVPTGLVGQTQVTQFVEPEPVLQVGEALGNSPEYSFTEISAISVIGDSILVLEGSANEIRIFNHNGDYLGRIGRNGEGPGEFLWPTAMHLVPEGLAVIDLRLRRQTFFTLAGDLIRTEPLGHLTDQAFAGSVVMRGGTLVAETAVSISNEGGAFPERLIVLTPPGGQRIDTVARYSTGYVPYRAPGSYGFLGIRAGAEGDWASSGDSLLAVVSGEPATLRWWRAGENGLELVEQLELPFRPEPFTRGDARDFVDETNRQRREAEDDQLPRSVQMDPPQYWGQVKQLVIGEDQECWIQWDRPRSTDDDEWIRVDMETRKIERTQLPNGFRMLAAVGGNLYGFVLSDLDAPLMTVFRLLRTR